MPAIEIKEKIYWVGALDWSIRDFHGYSTDKGTTYNAFLVLDDKVTLFDTVKKEFCGDYLRRIAEVIDPARIDYLVINHVEMDHSGSLPLVIDTVKPEKVFCSQKGREALLEHYHRPDWPLTVMESGTELSLGRRTVQFLETRMLHWPDSMFSYLKEDKLLISSDAFGQHWATSERFDDQVPTEELFAHAKKYFANILLPYAPLITKLIADVKRLGLAIDMIACDHGLIWRRGVGDIIAAYDEWSRQKPAAKAVVFYSTMWNSTETMARAIEEGLLAEGVAVRTMNTRFCHRSDIMTEIMDARALIAGSATLNNGIMPQMADVLTYVRGLRPRNKIAAAFGSFGWSGEAVKLIAEELAAMKAEVVDPGVRAKYVPDVETRKACVELGRKMGRLIRASV